MSSVSFHINGKPYTANTGDIPANTSLNTFIRNHAYLSGTKLMCNEGGCGACIVTVKRVQPGTKKFKTIAVNSCLMPVYACHDVHVTTIEGIGNCKDGYCPEQTRLVQKNGSQCGYCSSGMIMNMHSLLENGGETLTMAEVENSLSGNLCRCTGYRPILDAFKSLAVDASNELLCHDIEDLPKASNSIVCGGTCPQTYREALHLKFEDGSEWYKVSTITEILQILQNIDSTTPYILVAGNTAHGVYAVPYGPKIYIDINYVAELHNHSVMDNELIVGANNTLAEVEKLFVSVSETPGFEYCSDLAKHVDLIANNPVRNIGTIAGNLSIKHQHNRFPSDMFVILTAVGAKLTIIDANDNRKSIVKMNDFLMLDMSNKLIVNVKLPMLAKTFYKFKSYKVMIRAQNAHAYVNGAFLFKFNCNTVESARICFGGINPNFVRARDTEAFLCGKKLYANEPLQLAIQVLKNELIPDQEIVDASPKYRKLLGVSLFYRFVLSTCDQRLVGAENRSGANVLQRPLSSGKQTFDTNKDEYPLTEPIVKLEGMAQVSGAAKYTNDVHHLHNELWAVFVTATKVGSKLGEIDKTEAMTVPGVRHFFSALNIPGTNSFIPTNASLLGIAEEEQIFVGYNCKVLFHGQPVGIILADTFQIAEFAATKVKINYLEGDSYMSMARALLNPLIGGEKQITPTIQDVFNSKGKQYEYSKMTESKITDGCKTVEGRFCLPTQYHMHMEPQTTVCIPTDDGMLVHAATQWPDLSQIAIAQCLSVPENSIYIEVKRVGGGFGAKISRSSQVACACALGCHLTGRPVRFAMSLQANMTVVGKRSGMIGQYTADVDENGRIKKLSMVSYYDLGCSKNESPSLLANVAFANCYDASLLNWRYEDVTTDSASNTWFRAPGTLESVAMTEIVMEHISRATGKDPMAVRIANMVAGNPMITLIPQFVKDVDFNDRKMKIDYFNQKNRWNKKGIAITPMAYPILYLNTNTAYVTVCHNDGTVVVSHGGVEIGQGINTKITQVAAHTLGISHSSIKVRPTDNVIGSNCAVTGGSVTSEVICFSVTKACEEIMARLEPIRAKLVNPTWVQITQAAYADLIDLSVMHTTKATDLTAYTVNGLCCAELEIDLLTGNYLLHRVDILEDAGQSTNPLLDIGQIEGAFVMGIGYWLTEALKYNRMNAELVTNRTWNYKPPGAKDIPIDFRVNLLQNSTNPVLMLGSKGVGEPAITMSVALHLALRNALSAARSDAGIKKECWFELTVPSTPEIIALAAGHSSDSFKL